VKRRWRAKAAHADTTLTRGAFGHGTVSASHSATRPTPPECVTPAANPQGTQSNCTAINAGSFGTCQIHPGGTGSHCEITITATAAAGWQFDGWASGPCTATAVSCTFKTVETTCHNGGEICDDPNELGPWTAIAKFRDVRAPTAALTDGPAQNALLLTDTRQATFKFNTDEDDEAPTYTCALDGKAPVACASPFTLSQLADGEHDLCVTPRDASGTVGAAKCRHWEQQVNATATFTAAPPAATNVTGFLFTYAVNKPSPSFECRLDDSAFAPCPANGVALAGLLDGTHQFSVRAIVKAKFDAPGTSHTGPASVHTWRVDTTPPQTTITTGPADGAAIVDVAPTFEFGADEDG